MHGLPIGDLSSQETVLVSVLVIAGIGLLGVLLLAFVILWGHRLRRVARKPFPKHSLRDELWYLRPPKTSVEPSADTSDEDRSTTNDPDSDSSENDE